jgi:hypothetical protein
MLVNENFQLLSNYIKNSDMFGNILHMYFFVTLEIPANFILEFNF